MLTITIDKIQEYISLFQINHLVNYQKLYQKFTFLKTFNSECSSIEELFTDHNSKPIEIEDKTNLTVIINWF